MTSLALQTAVGTAIKTAISPTKIYDKVPDNTARPYVVMDSQLVTNEDGLSDGHERVTLYLSAWSDHKDSSQVLGILNTIKAALHNTKPTLSSGTCVILREKRRSTGRDIGEGSFIGYATYEAMITP